LRRYDERSAPVAIGTGAADLDAVRGLFTGITGAQLCALKCVSTAPLDPSCSGYRGDEGLEVLCLDFEGCEAACQREVPQTYTVMGGTFGNESQSVTTTGCVAFEMRGANRCRLIPDGAAADPASWDKQVGVAVYARQENLRTCRVRDDYVLTGSLAVTQRPHAGTVRNYVDWVFNPGEVGSVEIIGMDLSQHDRVMLVDPEGVCGRSAPGGYKGTLELSVLDLESSREESDAIYRPLGMPDLAAFMSWRPLVEDGAGVMPPQGAPRVAPLDRGFSSARILRFLGLRMRTGGKAKVCFCDSTREACDSKEAFLFDLGFVHSSGVACLLDSPILQRATCVPQYHGALRCYDGADAVPDYNWDVMSGVWVKKDDHSLNQTHICAYVDPTETGGAWKDVCPLPEVGGTALPDVPLTATPTPAPTDPSIVCEGVTADMLPEVAGCRRTEALPEPDASE
jgi:hypothetical protein